jgi:putative endonuclease
MKQPGIKKQTVKEKREPQEGQLERDRRARSWVLYVLRCKDGTFYCGITNHLERRILQHNAGKGARYTKGRGPVVLLKSWPAASMSAALKAERAFKALSKEEKQRKLRSRARKDRISLLLQPPKE